MFGYCDASGFCDVRMRVRALLSGAGAIVRAEARTGPNGHAQCPVRFRIDENKAAQRRSVRGALGTGATQGQQDQKPPKRSRNCGDS